MIGRAKFKIISSGSQFKDPKFDIPNIEVTFPNGHSDRLHLKHYNALPSSTNIDHSRLCNYLGNLKHDQDTNNKIQELVLLPRISKVLQTHAHVSCNLQCNL